MQKRNSSNFSKIAFIALFGAMALTAFRLVSKPTNLLQGVLSPLPQSSLLVGSSPNSQNDVPVDEPKFFTIDRTANGVDLVLHRPPALAVDAVEVTLVGSTNLVTATWSPFMNVAFPAGDTNVSATVASAMLDAHSVDNACFFAFINAGDSDGDGLADWDERFNLKTDPYEVDSDGDGLDDATEVDIGTDPVSADTDGDGLDDREEVDCVCEVGVNDWHVISGATTVFAQPSAGTTIDDDIRTVALPSSVMLGGVVYDRASIDVNGKVHLIPVDGAPVTTSAPGNLVPDEVGPGSGDLLIAAFWDDLEMRSTISSQIRFGVEASTGWLVVHYQNLHVASGDEEGAVLSFQVVIAPGDAFPVRINYRLYPPPLGAGATVGVFDRGRAGSDNPATCRSVVWSCNTPGVTRSNLSLGFSFGVGTDPLDPDLDGDGLLDGDELDFGTDPGRPDTDRDGMPDGWEVEHLLNPLLPTDGGGDMDLDGLTNLDEYLNDADPGIPDTDGDEVSDSAEVLAGSNPNDRTDNGVPPPASAIKTLNFNIHGDFAAWEMTIKGLSPGDTRVRRISMGVPGASPTSPLDMRKGCSYRLTMKWLNCDGHDSGGSGPWYCWQAKIDGLPSTRTFASYHADRLVGNEVVVGDGWFVENDGGLLTDHVCQNTADGAGNVAGKLEATLHVVDFTIVSDRLRSYDECVDGNLIDSRTATVTVSPALACGGRHSVTFESVPALEGTPVNDGNGTAVTFSKQGENTWKTTPFYWYGVFPDHECYYHHNKYVVTMKVAGQTVLTRECPVYFPERNAHPFWQRPTTNGTHPGAPRHYNYSTTEDFWYCEIEFVEFDKESEGFIYTRPNETDMLFSWSGQYFDETKAEEEFHLRQYRGLVPTSQGGQGDCFTIKGLKYFIAQQAITNSNIATSTWIVKGDTATLAVRNCWQVIHEAIDKEITISNEVMNGDIGFMELKVKEHVNYNAAFRYHCTYLDTYGMSPTNHVHPAYIGESE